MTTMGLEALKYNENKRANLANENIKERTLLEQRRSNLANEGIKASTLDEQIRSNKANERLRGSEISIANRNAAVNERNAAVNETNAETKRAEADIKGYDVLNKQRETNLKYADRWIAEADSATALGYPKAGSAATGISHKIYDAILDMVSFKSMLK